VSGPDDLDPPGLGLSPGPFGEPEAFAELPQNDTDPAPPWVIEKGEAMAALNSAISDFFTSYVRLESVAAAACRALDAMATEHTE
jgi:hypothetical protein